ncbi:helix-turn-helix transcriptional regulator [Catenuloplanes atrovinosus]|nr:helix-turn-helix transcriptional regulator [Catenuloplanes atrovinosus]
MIPYRKGNAIVIDRTGLADFLRRHREALQPEDVGLPRGDRRRARGLRREEVASLSHMSTVYYARLERQRGSQPSVRMVAAIAQGLHLTLDERDHLFVLTGHNPPARGEADDHIRPGLLHVFDRLSDTPAEIVNEIGMTLRQNVLGAALTGDTTSYTGFARSLAYRWFTDPEARQRYRQDDHTYLARLLVSRARTVAALRGSGSRAARLANLLFARSPEFRKLWNSHERSVQQNDIIYFAHPQVGALELCCQQLIDPRQNHSLLVYTATPCSESHDRLHLLSVIGTQVFPQSSPQDESRYIFPEWDDPGTSE